MYRKEIKRIVLAICIAGMVICFALSSAEHILRTVLKDSDLRAPVLSAVGIDVCMNSILAGIIICGIVFAVLAVILNHLIMSHNMESLACCNIEQTDKLIAMKETVSLLQEAYARKEKTNKAKSKFLNRMSHDLRTPMNAISGYSMLVEQVADEPDKVADYAQKIIVSSRTLMELIDGVLDMSYIETGNVKLVKHKFSLRSAFDEVNSAIKPQAECKRQGLHFYMNNSTGKDLVIGDKQRLCQILRNVLSNAVKYTQEGGSIDFIINVIDGSNNNLQMLCQIKDNGCGMSKTFMEGLFRPFVREDNALNTSVPGTGLGMSIAGCFTELMSGTISVESEVDVGTLVTIMIPFESAVEERISAKCVFENEEVLRGLKILAAEDNESNAEILNEVLTAMGAECVIAADGQEAAMLFEESEPGEYDLILMDIQMPVMNGYQATAAIRKCRHPRAKDIVIVAMTADAFEEDVQKAFVSGMNAHVAKPLDLQSFINTIKSLQLER